MNVSDLNGLLDIENIIVIEINEDDLRELQEEQVSSYLYYYSIKSR